MGRPDRPKFKLTTKAQKASPFLNALNGVVLPPAKADRKITAPSPVLAPNDVQQETEVKKRAARRIAASGRQSTTLSSKSGKLGG